MIFWAVASEAQAMVTSTRRAAQYVRMSKESQRYSIEYQTATNGTYAAARDLVLVKTYSDAGISGVTLQKRPGLRRLLADVLAGAPGFEVILVYDVSRWGRFQDPDESAHYEYLCRSAGVAVHYTAETFPADHSLLTSLLKHMKRAMAAEFSRDLSARVSLTQRGLGAKGYWMGGPTAYGLDRVVVDPAGKVRIVLKPGQRSALKGDRVVLAPGPRDEVRLVRRIFRLFVEDGLSAREISMRLNAEGRLATRGARWTSIRVRNVLRNEAYVGVNVIGKARHSLGEMTPMPRTQWIRAEGAFRPVISRAVFDAAQLQFRANKPVVDDETLLAELRDAWRRNGALSRGVIDRDPQTHCAWVYQMRFGNLSAAYRRIGYPMTRHQAAMSATAFRDRPHLRVGRRSKVPDAEILEKLAAVLTERGRLSKEIISGTPGVPHSHALSRRFGGLQGLYARLGYAPSERQLLGMRTGRVRRAPPLRDLGQDPDEQRRG